MEYEEPQDYHGLFLGEDQSWQAAGSGWGRGLVDEIGHDSVFVDPLLQSACCFMKIEGRQS